MTGPEEAEPRPGLVRMLQRPSFGDRPGAILEIVGDEALAGRAVRNLHAVVAEPGEVRGNHLHRDRTEVVTVVSGHFHARFEEARSGAMVDFDDVPAGASFEIPPGVAHALRNVGETAGVLVCYSDQPFDRHDVEPARLLGPAPERPAGISSLDTPGAGRAARPASP